MPGPSVHAAYDGEAVRTPLVPGRPLGRVPPRDVQLVPVAPGVLRDGAVQPHELTVDATGVRQLPGERGALPEARRLLGSAAGEPEPELNHLLGRTDEPAVRGEARPRHLQQARDVPLLARGGHPCGRGVGHIVVPWVRLALLGELL